MNQGSCLELLAGDRAGQGSAPKHKRPLNACGPRVLQAKNRQCTCVITTYAWCKPYDATTRAMSGKTQPLIPWRLPQRQWALVLLVFTLTLYKVPQSATVLRKQASDYRMCRPCASGSLGLDCWVDRCNLGRERSAAGVGKGWGAYVCSLSNRGSCAPV